MSPASDYRLYPQFGAALANWPATPAGRYYPSIMGSLAEVAMAHYVPRQLVLPNADNATLAANAQHETRLTVAPGTYLVGFSGYSQRTPGFEVQIIDLRDGSKMFSGPQMSTNLCPSGSVEGITFPVQYLPRPRIIVEPAMLGVQIHNLDTANTNEVQLVLWCLEPEDPNVGQP
jgi:hypothetical protein